MSVFSSFGPTPAIIFKLSAWPSGLLKRSGPADDGLAAAAFLGAAFLAVALDLLAAVLAAAVLLAVDLVVADFAALLGVVAFGAAVLLAAGFFVLAAFSEVEAALAVLGEAAFVALALPAVLGAAVDLALEAAVFVGALDFVALAEDVVFAVDAFLAAAGFFADVLRFAGALLEGVDAAIKPTASAGGDTVSVFCDCSFSTGLEAVASGVDECDPPVAFPDDSLPK